MKWINKKSICIMRYKPISVSRLFKMNISKMKTYRAFSMLREEFQTRLIEYEVNSLIKVGNLYSDYEFYLLE